MAAPPPGGSPGSAERLLALSASQARLPALEAFAAAAHARSRAAAQTASTRRNVRSVEAALGDASFRTAFLAVLRDVAATLAALKAQHGANFWAVHAGLVGDRRLARTIDDLALAMERLLADQQRNAAAQPRRKAPAPPAARTMAAPARYGWRPARKKSGAVRKSDAGIREVGADVTTRALPPPSPEPRGAEHHADDAAAAAEHEALTAEEAESAAMLAEALAALDAAEAEHARTEAEHARAVAEALAARDAAEAKHTHIVEELAHQQQEDQHHDQAPARCATPEPERAEIEPWVEAPPVKDKEAVAGDDDEERPATPKAEGEGAAPRGLSRGVLATLQALEAAAGGAKLGTVSKRAPRPRA
jgi:hypothetical protein